MSILVFGGAFDPPHSEHKNMLLDAIDFFGVNTVVVVPTFMPPHKSVSGMSFDTRIQAINATFAEIPANIIIDDIERQRASNNYSYLVLEDIKKKYNDDIIFLIGGDSFLFFDSWKNPEKIVDIATIAVALRDGFDFDTDAEQIKFEQKYGAKVQFLRYKGKEIASSSVKAHLLLGDSVECIHSATASLMFENQELQRLKDMVCKVKSYQSDDLFEHTKAVVMTAIDLNNKFNLKQDFVSVFVSALLHDNAKQRLSLDNLTVPDDAVGTPVLHQFLGAEKAQRDFGILNTDILDAIRYHTTARRDMSLLERLIYTADSVSYDRDYEPIGKLRQVVFDDFDKGFLAVLEWTCNKLKNLDRKIYPLTDDAYKYYCCESMDTKEKYATKRN